MNKSEIKVGTYTSALFVIATGAALLGHWVGLNSITWLMNFSPAFLIVLGCEYLLLANKAERTTLAWGRIITSLVICLVVTTAFIGFDWFYGESEAKSLPQTEHTLSSDVEELKIDNVNGSVTILTHNKRTIKIESHVKYPLFGMKRGEVEVEAYEKNSTFYIDTDGPRFRFLFIQSHPSIHLTVYVPEDHPFDVDIEQKNGKIIAEDILLLESFHGKTTNGNIEVREMEGEFHLKSTNGRITVKDIKGNVEAKSTNGKLEIDGEIGRIIADTTNGSITASSDTILDDWDIKTTNGSLTLTLPKGGDLELSARTTNGSISAPEPFEVDGKRVTGKLGSGKYEVTTKTTNGRLTIHTE